LSLSGQKRVAKRHHSPADRITNGPSDVSRFIDHICCGELQHDHACALQIVAASGVFPSLGIGDVAPAPADLNDHVGSIEEEVDPSQKPRPLPEDHLTLRSGQIVVTKQFEEPSFKPTLHAGINEYFVEFSDPFDSAPAETRKSIEQLIRRRETRRDRGVDQSGERMDGEPMRQIDDRPSRIGCVDTTEYRNACDVLRSTLSLKEWKFDQADVLCRQSPRLVHLNAPAEPPGLCGSGELDVRVALEAR